jgi:hypothetical protein
MHIITPTQGQRIDFIPRVPVASPSFQIIDESTNKDITSDVLNSSGSYSNGFSVLFINFKIGKFPIEGRFYYFKAFAANGSLCYQDRLFCTAQTEYDKYTVNQNVYTEETSYDNEYIII